MKDLQQRRMVKVEPDKDQFLLIRIITNDTILDIRCDEFVQLKLTEDEVKISLLSREETSTVIEAWFFLPSVQHEYFMNRFLNALNSIYSKEVIDLRESM
jgi:hypothetical protein